MTLFPQQSHMDFSTEKTFNMQSFLPEYVVPNGSYLVPNIGTISWHHFEIMGSQINRSISIVRSCPMIFKPFQLQFPEIGRQTYDFEYKKEFNQNLQNIEGNQDKEKINETGLNLKSEQFQEQKDDFKVHKKVIKKIQKKCNQNPRRNTVTNIGNQLLTFITNKSKCLKAFPNLYQLMNQNQWPGFFSFTKKLRNRIGYYLNFSKMRNIWYPKQLSSSYRNYLKTLRTISYYFLSHMMRLVVINSGKMQKKSKTFHMKAIRKLIKDIRTPPKFG